MKNKHYTPIYTWGHRHSACTHHNKYIKCTIYIAHLICILHPPTLYHIHNTSMPFILNTLAHVYMYHSHNITNM